MPMSNRATIPLCILSEAAGGEYVNRRGLWDGNTFEHQGTCPLGLTPAEARRCPCKTRIDAGEVRNEKGKAVRVQVLACLFPETWDGDTIRNPEAFARYLRKKAGR